MKKPLSRMAFALLIIVHLCCQSQEAVQIPRSSIFYELADGDSLLIYQCRVLDPTDENQNTDYVKGAVAPYTLTDKIFIKRSGDSLHALLFSTHIRDFPNRKFSGLKVRERPYWQFVRAQKFSVHLVALLKLARLEHAGREAIEYDYPLTKYTRNQIIIKRGKDFRQLVYSKPVVAARLMQ